MQVQGRGTLGRDSEGHWDGLEKARRGGWVAGKVEKVQGRRVRKAEDVSLEMGNGVRS